MAFFDFMKKSYVVEEAAPITEMTSEDYCKISREYKEKAIAAMKLDFETRVKEKKFCVGDFVRLPCDMRPLVYWNHRISPKAPWEHKTFKIEFIKEVCGVKFARINFHTNVEHVMYPDSMEIVHTHIVWAPIGALEAIWDDNKPRKC